MVTSEENLARLIWQYGEPVHAVTYFAPERQQRTDALGLKGGWMSYFGCRAAPLGAATPAVVTAVLYVFDPRMVRRAIPDAWAIARPEQLLDARLDAVDETLRRVLGDAVDSADVRRAADGLRAAIEGCDVSGRTLGGANADVPLSSTPHLSLWQSLTTMRELRGDGHVIALVDAGIAPCEALVLQAATGRSDAVSLRGNRGWAEEDWSAAGGSLQARGWVDAAGAVTDAGRLAREGVEDATNRMASSIVHGIGADAGDGLVALLRPLAEAVMASGTVSAVNNMGLPWPPVQAD
jgi:hypothetical protein